MDKVIIDGVDVSECKYYDDGTCCDKDVMSLSCENTDCIYKQLKRLQHYQAEFEHELMNDYTYDGYISPNGFTPIDVIKHIKSELKRLQAENKKLKYYLNKIREDELNSMDVEWDEYITECTSTEYTNVITFVELALGERDE